MFLLRRQVQLLVNIAVVVSVIGFVALGAVMVLPARSPMGSLLGSIASDAELLSNMLKHTEPEAVAEALNENPNFISDIDDFYTDWIRVYSIEEMIRRIISLNSQL